jgi:deoxyribonuclease-4
LRSFAKTFATFALNGSSVKIINAKDAKGSAKERKGDSMTVAQGKIKRPKIGFHAPIKGGLHESLIVAKDTGCDAVQIFSRNPRGWLAKPLTEEAIGLFRKTRRQTKLSPVLIHTNYLINLAAADETILFKSIASFREEVERAITLGADYLVIHPGSARGSNESDAIKICALSLKLSCQGLKFGRLRILLENTAGQGQCIGNRFEHLRAIMDACPELPLGVCVDTAHSFTAGYDIREADGLEATLEIIRRTVGLRNVRAVHFNDSRAPYNSRVDRHWHIGEGHIGREALRRLAQHPKLAHAAFILETPYDDPRADLKNLQALRSFVSGTG